MTHPEICKAYVAAGIAMSRHDVTVMTDGKFYLMAKGSVVHGTESVDGLTSFAAALDFARGAA